MTTAIRRPGVARTRQRKKGRLMFSRSQYKRLFAAIVAVLLSALAIAPGVALACEGGEEPEKEGTFAIQASPTSVTKPKPKSTVTITETDPFHEATVKEIAVSGESGEFSFSVAKCVKKYAISEKCEFTVTYLGSHKANVKFVAINLEKAGSGTAGVTGTPPLEASLSELNFEKVKVGTELHKTVKIKANETVNMKAAKTEGAAFKVVSDKCNGVKLEAAKECEIEAGFAPKEVGKASGTLEVPFEVASSKELGALSLPLKGEGS